MIDVDTVASAGLLRGGASRGGGRGARRRAAAGRREQLRLLRPAPAGPPRRGVRAMGFCLFNNVAVAAAHALAACGAERVLVARLGRPPRQRHRGDLRRLRSRALREHPPVAALSRVPGPAEYRARARGRATRSTCPVPPGRGAGGVPGAGQHVVAPIARDFGRTWSRSRPATTPTATTRSPMPGGHRGLRRHGRDDARAGGRAERAGARLPRGRLRPGGAGGVGAGHDRGSRWGTAKAAEAAAEPARPYVERQRDRWPALAT